VGGLINRLFSPNQMRPAKRNAGLIITHSGNILRYLNIDKAHIMYEGRIGCSGNPAIMLEKIGRCGYEECVRCMERGD
jgi:Fe-S cluster assembly ATP-binding protein